MNTAYKSVRASVLGVEPCLLRGREKRGVLFMTWADSPVVGAQCSRCGTVVWVEQRTHPVLTEQKPAGVPESGAGYRAYWHSKLERFLSGLPPCPVCGSVSFKRFINNASPSAFADGSELPANVNPSDIVKADGDQEIYVLDSPSA